MRIYDPRNEHGTPLLTQADLGNVITDVSIAKDTDTAGIDLSKNSIDEGVLKLDLKVKKGGLTASTGWNFHTGFASGPDVATAISRAIAERGVVSFTVNNTDAYDEHGVSLRPVKDGGSLNISFEIESADWDAVNSVFTPGPQFVTAEQGNAIMEGLFKLAETKYGNDIKLVRVNEMRQDTKGGITLSMPDNTRTGKVLDITFTATPAVWSNQTVSFTTETENNYTDGKGVNNAVVALKNYVDSKAGDAVTNVHVDYDQQHDPKAAGIELSSQKDGGTVTFTLSATPAVFDTAEKDFKREDLQKYTTAEGVNLAIGRLAIDLTGNATVNQKKSDTVNGITLEQSSVGDRQPNLNFSIQSAVVDEDNPSRFSATPEDGGKLTTAAGVNNVLDVALEPAVPTVDGDSFVAGGGFVNADGANSVQRAALSHYSKKYKSLEFTPVDGKITVTDDDYTGDIQIVSIVETGKQETWMGDISGSGSTKVITLWDEDEAPADAESLSFTVTYLGA